MTGEMARTKTAEIALDRRAAPRLLVAIDVDYRDQDTYLFASSRDISETGLFVRTLEPLPPGTRLSLRFRPDAADDGAADDDDDDDALRAGAGSREPAELLELEGEVIWVNPYRPDALTNLDPGMGVRFIGLRAPVRRRLLELIRRIAYID